MILTIDPSFEAIVQASLFVILNVLGFVIITIAFQGYRRNKSRPMLFLAIGIAALIVPELAMDIVSLFVTLSPFEVVTVYQLTNVVAFLCFLRAITMNLNQSRANDSHRDS